MNPIIKNHDEPLSAQERAAKIEALAQPIIDEAKRRESERHQRNEKEMEKLKRLLEGGTP